MKNITSKLKNNFKKIIPIAVALSTFAFNSLAYTKENSFSFDQIPLKPEKYSEHVIKESETSFQYSKGYWFSRGLIFKESEKILKIKDSSFKWDMEDGEATIKNKNDEKVSISNFFKEGIDVFSNEKVIDIFIKISEGMPLEDVVLSEKTNTTIREIIEFAKAFDSISETSEGENFYNYQINLLGTAELTSSILTTQIFQNQKGLEFELIHGTNVKALANAEAYFEIGADWNKSISIEDLIITGESFEGNIYGKIGYNYSLLKSIEEFWQFRQNSLTFGVLQKISEIEKISYDARFILNLEADFETILMSNTTIKKEYESIKKRDSQLAYGILDLENLLFMAGVSQDEIKEKIKLYEEKIILNSNGEEIEKIDNYEIVTNRFKAKVFYGLSHIKDTIFMPKIKTSVSLFGSITNYSKENNQFGMLLKNPYLNSKLNHKGNYETFFTIIGNKNNPFYDYFKEKIKQTINPIEKYLESKLHTDLLRELNGVFLTYSEKDKTRKFGGVVGFSNKSYIELGQINGENKQGNYLKIGLPSFQMKFNSEINSHLGGYGESKSLEISGVKKGWNINLELEPMVNEMGIENVKLYFSRTF